MMRVLDNEGCERWEVELIGECDDDKADDDMDRESTGVERVIAHTLEDDRGTMDGVDDSRKTRRGTLGGDIDVGARRSRGVIGTVTGHGAEMVETMEALDNLVFALREDSSEIVGVQNHQSRVVRWLPGAGLS